MDPRLLLVAALIAPAVLVSPPAGATHDEASLPLSHADVSTHQGLAWLAGYVDDDGCAHSMYAAGCRTELTKWYAITAAHAGLDPTRWPTAEASVLGWLLDHADDLDDEVLTRCDPDEEDCRRYRVLSLAKSVLAFRSAGLDPREIPLAGDDHRDTVEELLDTYEGGEFGRPDAVNDDIWALLALNSVGYAGDEVQGAIARTEGAQGADGGVSHTQGQLPDVDTTSSAVWALAPHDRTAFLDRARGFLADSQLTEGDTRGCWPHRKLGLDPVANTESTAWALQAVAGLDEDPLAWSIDGQGPIDCVLANQNEDGGFGHTRSSGSGQVESYQAVIALAWAPYGARTQPASTHTIEQQATVGEEHEAVIPGGFIRVGEQARQALAWTPSEETTRTFHGWRTDPIIQRVELVVTAEERTRSRSSASSGSPSDPVHPPTLSLDAPATAERNRSTTVQLAAEPADAPVTGLKVDWGDGHVTDWSAAEQPSHTYRSLGPVTLQAWARDADGDVSDAVSADLLIEDARPILEIHAPAAVPRHTSFELTADAQDPDGPPPRVTWRLGEHAWTGMSANATVAAPGEHRLEATAVDEAGNEVHAQATIVATNAAPTNLTIHPTQLPANETTVVQANATDPDSDPLTFTWLAQGNRSWGRQLHVTTGPPGELTLTLNVTDAHGGWALGELSVAVVDTPAPSEPAELKVQTSQESPQDPSPSKGIETPRPGTPRVELTHVIHGQPGVPTLVQGRAHQANGSITAVALSMGQSVPVRGQESWQALVPALPNGTYEIAARAAGTQGAWGPWTTATLIVEQPSEPRDEPLSLLEAPKQGDARGTPLGLLVPLVALILAARRRDP